MAFVGASVVVEMSPVVEELAVPLDEEDPVLPVGLYSEGVQVALVA